MYQLDTLGRTGLTDADGAEIERLLRQPKRLALLAYLASPSPGTWHRRDILLGVFWPELDSVRGRTALRNALHVIRQHVGDTTIRARGDEEVSLDPTLIATDTHAMEVHAAAGRHAEALAAYRGPYLHGLFVRDAAEFERWLDGERQRLAAIARRSGLAHAGGLEQRNDFAGAAEVLERLSAIDPTDEVVGRRLIDALDRSGDGSRALAVYERLRTRLAEEFGAEPSRETNERVAAIRSSRAQPRTDAPSVSILMESPRQSPVPSATSIDPARPGPASGVVAPTVPPRGSRWRKVAGVGSMVAALLTVVLVKVGSPVEARPSQLLVLPMTNATGDAGLTYLAAGIAEDIARLVRGIGGLQTVHSAVQVDLPATAVADPLQVGREYSAKVALRSELRRAGDSLSISAALIDMNDGRERDLGRVVFGRDGERDAAGQLAAAIAGAMFRAALPQVPHPQPGPPLDPVSSRLSMLGWWQLLGLRDTEAAYASFNAALKADPNNARAWAGLSSVWSSRAVTSDAEFEVAAEYGDQAGQAALKLDSLEGTPWANLGIIRALRSRRLDDGLPLIDRGIELDPSNPELYKVKAALLRHAWQWRKALQAARFASSMDPLSPGYVTAIANLYRCMGDARSALVEDRRALALDSTREATRIAVARDLARLRQWSDAVAMLRPGMPVVPDSAEAQYWQIMESRWQVTLRRHLEKAQSGWVSPAMTAVLTIASGDLDRGIAMLEEQASSGDPGLYRLPCMEQVDRVRSWPRFQKIQDGLPRWRD